MKRLLTSLCLLLALSLAAPALADTTLMVATDLHYIAPTYFEGSDLLRYSAEIGDGKMPHESAAWLSGLVAEAILVKPDALILAGDQTYNGEVLSHRAVSDAMAEVEAAGIPVLVIPGNHDVNNDNAFQYLADGYEAVHSLTPERYAKYYEAYGWAHAFDLDPASGSYAVALRDGLWVILLDASIFEPMVQTYGFIEEETVLWLTALLEKAQAEDVQVLTVTHQSLLPHSERNNAGYMVVNWRQITALLAQYGVRLNLSGHLHIQHIAERDGFYDVSLSSLSAFPHHYALVTIEEGGAIDYRTQDLRAEVLPEGLRERSEAFFQQVNVDKITRQVQNTAASEEEKTQMIGFAARLNRLYYAGEVAQYADEARQDPAYALWEQHSDEEGWLGYLQSMLGPDIRDMTRLRIEAE